MTNRLIIKYNDMASFTMKFKKVKRTDNMRGGYINYTENRSIESFRCTSRQKAEAALSKRRKDVMAAADFYDAQGNKTNLYTQSII